MLHSQLKLMSRQVRLMRSGKEPFAKHRQVARGFGLGRFPCTSPAWTFRQRRLYSRQWWV